MNVVCHFSNLFITLEQSITLAVILLTGNHRSSPDKKCSRLCSEYLDSYDDYAAFVIILFENHGNKKKKMTRI